MTQIKDKAIENKSIILTFDICNSSIIIEDLARSDNLSVVRDMFLELRDWLRDNKESYNFEIYNFTGDGWILLFPSSSTGNDLVKFMINLLVAYKKIMETFVITRMEHKPEIIGMSFGAAKGPVVEFTMFDRTEFVGRPINVACRLQGVIKELVKEENETTASKLCVPRALYHEKFEKVPWLSSIQRDIPLHNIAGGSNYQCVLVNLLGPS